MEIKASEKPTFDYDLEYKMRTWQVFNTAVERGELGDYLKAGSATGFKVTEIADVGEKFPVFDHKDNVMREVRLEPPERHGMPLHIAVSIEKLGGNREDLQVFWAKLNRLKQEKAQPAPKPTAKQ